MIQNITNRNSDKYTEQINITDSDLQDYSRKEEVKVLLEKQLFDCFLDQINKSKENRKVQRHINNLNFTVFRLKKTLDQSKKEQTEATQIRQSGVAKLNLLLNISQPINEEPQYDSVQRMQSFTTEQSQTPRNFEVPIINLQKKLAAFERCFIQNDQTSRNLRRRRSRLENRSKNSSFYITSKNKDDDNDSSSQFLQSTPDQYEPMSYYNFREDDQQRYSEFSTVQEEPFEKQQKVRRNLNDLQFNDIEIVDTNKSINQQSNQELLKEIQRLKNINQQLDQKVKDQEKKLSEYEQKEMRFQKTQTTKQNPRNLSYIDTQGYLV